MAFNSIIKGARRYGNEALMGLGGIGTKGTMMRGMSEGTSPFGPMTDSTRAMARQGLTDMGKKRAAVGVVGMGAIGMSSGASGMRARSSGGYTG